MPICTLCGERNPDDVSRCGKCGATLGSQMRAKADAQRSQIWSVIRPIGWIIVAVAVICIVPITYHSAFAAYYKYRVTTITESAMKMCGGPLTATTTEYQKADIEHCMENDEALSKAKEDYENFTKGGKH